MKVTSSVEELTVCLRGSRRSTPPAGEVVRLSEYVPTPAGLDSSKVKMSSWSLGVQFCFAPETDVIRHANLTLDDNGG